jgi:drug/metabolite transporter (DMT)-like permease
MDKNLRAYLYLSGGFILAGSSVAAAKLLLGLPVFFASAAGTAVALVILLPLSAAEARPAPGALRRALPLALAQALLGVALFRVLMLEALRFSSAALAGVATGATPALTACAAALFLKERIGPRKAAGIALAAAGIACLRLGEAAPGGGRELLGCLLALGAAAAESGFNLLSKLLPASLGPRRASALVMALALAMLAALSLVSGEQVELGAIGLRRWLALAYQGIFSSALAYVLWFAGVARVPVSTAGAFAGLMPLSAFGLAVAFLGERPSATGFAGAALAIGGIVLCAAGERRGGRVELGKEAA